MKQKTIKSSITLEGIGIHSGKNSKIIIDPAPANSGINFKYKDENPIKAEIKNVTADKLETSLGKIRLIEHLLAAAAGLQINNLLIQTDSSEIPILDGSSLPFVSALEDTGIVEQDALVKFIKLKKELRVEYKEKYIEAYPSDGFTINFMVNYPVIGSQNFSFDGSLKVFKREIAPARTFGFMNDLEELTKSGYAKGASLENCLAISDAGYVNQARFKYEPVKHKILDLIGDFALAGKPITAKIVANQSNHQLNQEFVRVLLKNKEAFND